MMYRATGSHWSVRLLATFRKKYTGPPSFHTQHNKHQHSTPGNNGKRWKAEFSCKQQAPPPSKKRLPHFPQTHTDDMIATKQTHNGGPCALYTLKAQTIAQLDTIRSCNFLASNFSQQPFLALSPALSYVHGRAVTSVPLIKRGPATVY